MASKNEAPPADEVAEAEIELYLSGKGFEIEIPDAEEIARRQLAKLLGAQSEDDLFAGATAESVEDFLGVPLIIEGVSWNKSDPAYGDTGPGFFAVIDAKGPDGAKHTLTTGARNVMATLYVAQRKGLLPFSKPVKIVKTERETAAGFHPMVMVQA